MSPEQKLANRRKRWGLAFDLVERGEARLQVIECVELVKQGFGIPGIAEKLGLAKSTVAQRLKDPTGEKNQARKRKRHGSCKDCGAPTYNGGSLSLPERCDSCYRRRQGEQRSQIIEAWERGDSLGAISKRFGITVNALLTSVNSWRAAGYSVSYRHLPRRNTEARYKRIAEMVRDARSNAEIAREIGTTRESVARMTVMMRRKGYNLPRRIRGKNGGVKLA